MKETIVTFLVCFTPGLCLGYAACALIHNRRTARPLPPADPNWKATHLFVLHDNKQP